MARTKRRPRTLGGKGENSEHTDKIAGKFEQLLAEGRQLLAACGWNGSQFRAFPPDEIYSRIRAEAGDLIRTVCGEQSHHYLEFRGIADQKYGASPAHLPAFLGVLEAACRDYEGDLSILDDLLIVSVPEGQTLTRDIRLPEPWDTAKTLTDETDGTVAKRGRNGVFRAVQPGIYRMRS